MIHPLTDVHTNIIGEGTRIWQSCVILPNIEIGSNSNVCAHVLIENGVRIRNNVTLKSGVQLWTGLIVDDDVFIGSNAILTNDHTLRSGQHIEKYLETKICKGASIGANGAILCGITICENAIIGAGAVVTKDVPANIVWYGNPARMRTYMDECENITLLELDSYQGVKQTIIYRQTS